MNNIDYPDNCFNSLDMLGFNPLMTTDEYLKMVLHQRNVLAQEIKNFLVKTGGIVEDCIPNGPELVAELRSAGDYFQQKETVILSHVSGI